MSLRGFIGLALIGGAGYIAYDIWRGGFDGLVSPPAGTDDGSGDGTDTGSSITAPSQDYLDALSKAEDPSGNPYEKNPYSTASGLFQFTKATWVGLGGQWGSDDTQAFGGLTPSVDEQYAMAAKLTQQNAGILDKLGIAINNVSLYAAHIFGPSKAAPILGADPSTSLAAVTSPHIVATNPALGTTVQSFFNYLNAKVG